MKKITLFFIYLVCFMTGLATTNSYADIVDLKGDFSLGLGNLTKYVGKIQTDLNGSRNYTDFNPFIRANFRTDFFWDKKLILEAGLTIPKEANDDAVTVTNLWLQALVEHTIHNFRLQAGLGLFFTYIKMDGKNQTLGNGTSLEQSFYTPEDTHTAVNNIALLGSDYLINEDFFVNGQLSIFNIEDSSERAFSYAISLNYNLGSIK